jgi:PPOX class probable F420-dependent enzyme
MIDDAVRALAEAPNFAAFTTLLPDGMPMTHVMWVDADDTHVLINTEVGRQKYRNVERDPRVVVTVVDQDNPYRYAEVRGRVVERVTGPAARAHIDTLSRKYRGADYDGLLRPCMWASAKAHPSASSAIRLSVGR